MCFNRTALKAFLLIMNVLLFLCGGIVLGIGIWAVVAKIYVVADVVGNSLISSAAYLLVVCGCLLIVISFFGCLGAVTNKKLFVIVYIIAVVLIFILMMSAGIAAAVFQDDIEDGMRTSMQATIRDRYGYNVAYDNDNRDLTKSWDTIQTKLKCCGVDNRGWALYQESRWFMQQFNQFDRKYVPESCCVYVGNLRQYLNVQSCQSFAYGPPVYTGYGGAENGALHYEGCYEAAKQYASSQSTIFLAVGFSFCVFLIASIVVAIMFLREISKSGNGSADLRNNRHEYR